MNKEEVRIETEDTVEYIFRGEENIARAFTRMDELRKTYGDVIFTSDKDGCHVAFDPANLK